MRIASSLAVAVMPWVWAWTPAAAASPLLSGYGAPGAGEQAVIEAGLLNAHRGGSGAGGSPGAGSSSGAGAGGSVGAGVNGSAGAGVNGSAGAGHPSAGGPASPGAGQSGATGSSRRGHGSGEAGGAHAYLYPSALRATPASPALGLSGGDLLLVLAIAAGIVVLGFVTVRVARLQQ